MNHKSIIAIAAFFAMTSMNSYAENIIRTPAPIVKSVEAGSWSSAEPLYGEWVTLSEDNCTNWLPLPENVQQGREYTQISTCSVSQSRTRTEREVNSLTGAYRNIGASTEETRSLSLDKNRLAIGTGQFEEKYFVVGWLGCAYGQYGYSTNNTCGNNVFHDGSVPSSSITYFTYGYNNAINFGTNPRTYPDKLTYLKVEMMDADGNVYYVDEYFGGFTLQAGTYIGPKHSSEAYSKAMTARRFRITYRTLLQ